MRAPKRLGFLALRFKYPKMIVYRDSLSWKI